MSHISPGDEDLHYEDGSHRWTGGDGSVGSEELWRARMAAHKAAHQAGGRGVGARWWPGRLRRKRPGKADDVPQ